MKFEDAVSLREAREQFFQESGFSEEQYDDRFVIVKIWGFPLPFPNSKERKRAVRYHDLHHILTEYDTTWTGEAEVSAWELATGCKNYLAAWILDGLIIPLGLIIAPRRVIQAFKRGLRTRNLYGSGFNDKLLSESVGAVRKRLSLKCAG